MAPHRRHPWPPGRNQAGRVRQVTDAAAARGAPRATQALTPVARFPSSDGVSVAVHRLHEPTGDDRRQGGLPWPVVAVHATGFCAAVLAPLAAELAAGARRPDLPTGARRAELAAGPLVAGLGAHPVVGPDERGHGASSRPASGSFAWQGFADDVLAAVDGIGLDRPFGIGHSCGGAALILAELARPGTFRGLYLFEPVIPPVDPPAPGGMPDNPLSAGAHRRRPSFPSRQAAYDNFAGKPPFDVFDPRALAAYVANGFRPDGEDGITLCCRREDEAAVYAAAFAHDAYARAGAVRCPVTVACGEATDAFPADALAPVVERLPRGDLVVLPGLGHFGPMQDPGAVAASVLGSAAWAAAGSATGGPAGSPPGGTPLP